MTTTVQCPEDGGDIEIEVTREMYGEDYDGHRGQMRTCVEVIKQDCDCEFSDEAIDSLLED